MPAQATPRPTPELPRWLRSVLPGALIEAEADRTRRDRVVDVAMWLIAIAVSAAVLVGTWTQLSDWLRAVDLLIGLTSLVALRWRRSHPAAVGLVLAGVSIVSPSAAGPAVLATFNAAIRARGVHVVSVAGLSVANAVLFPLIYPSAESYGFELAFGLLLVGIIIGWGLFVRARRELGHVLREQARHVETGARESERRRIAGEMHDVLAHRLSLLSVHAGALEFRPDAPAEEIGEAAGVIRRSAREALEELRDVIGVLREPRGDGPPEPPEPPQPTLADLPALVEESRAAGMRVRLELAATTQPVPTAVGRTAYRIVQEGLTNARKHAPGAAVDVALAGTVNGRLLSVAVRSRPPVGVLAAADLPGAGTGLAGLAERVALAGGSLSHGTEPTGDFVLHAWLPLPLPR